MHKYNGAKWILQKILLKNEGVISACGDFNKCKLHSNEPEQMSGNDGGFGCYCNKLDHILRHNGLN